MASDTFEINLLLDIEDKAVLKDLDDLFTDIEAKVKPLSATIGDIKTGMRELTISGESLLDVFEQQLSEARLQYKLNQDDMALREKYLNTIEMQKALLGEIFKDTESHFAKTLDRAGKHLNQLDRANTLLNKNTKQTKTWADEMNNLGLGNLVKDAKAFVTLGGQLALWRAMFMEGTKQMSEWRAQNFALYGSMEEIAGQVRTIQGETNVLQAEAQAATGALMNMAVDPDSIVELGSAVAEFTSEARIGALNTARLAKQMQVAGQDKLLPQYLKNTQGAMAKFGLTGQEVDDVVGTLADSVLLLRNTVGEDKFPEAANNMLVAAGAAKAAGMDMKEFGGIIQKLTDDVTQFAVLLGDDLKDALDMGDPGQAFLMMSENAADALKMAEGFPKGMRNALAKDVFGMSIAQLEQMDEINKKVQEYNAELKSQGMLEGDRTKALAKYAEEQRRLNDPQFAFQQSMEELKNIFVEVVMPIIRAAAAFAKWFSVFLDTPGVKETILLLAKILGIIIAVTVAAKILFGVVSLVTGAFKLFGIGLTAASSGMSAMTATAKGMAVTLKSFGVGLGQFFMKTLQGIGNGLKAFGPKALAGAAALLVVAAAVWVMSKAMQGFSEVTWSGVAMGIVTMIAMTAMVALLGAIMMSGVGAVAILAGAAALAIIAVAMIPAAYAANLFADALAKLTPFVSAFGEVMVNVINALASGFVSVISMLFDKFIEFSAASIGPGLLGTAAGITAISAALIAFGAAAAGGGFMEWVGSWFADDPVEKFTRFAALGDKVAAAGVKIGRFVDSLIGLQQVTSDAAIESISAGLEKHAVNIEMAAGRMIKAMSGLAFASHMLALSDFKDMVETNSIITVKNEISDEATKDNNVSMLERLEEIRDGIVHLTGAVENIDPGSGTNIEEIKRQLVQWLPLIAETDSGLATTVNQWVNNQG